MPIFPTGDARDPHTMVFDGHGHIWFTSQHANRVGRQNMETGEYALVQPYDTPARLYAITKDVDERLWISETGAKKQFVSFDPHTEQFVSVNPVSQTIRHAGDGTAVRPTVVAHAAAVAGDGDASQAGDRVHTLAKPAEPTATSEAGCCGRSSCAESPFGRPEYDRC